MKGLKIKLLALLLIGAMVNIGVAWAMAVQERWWMSAVWRRPPMEAFRIADPPFDAAEAWRYLQVQRTGAAAVTSWSQTSHRLGSVSASVSFGSDAGGDVQTWLVDDGESPKPPWWTRPRRWFAGDDPPATIAIHHEFASGWPCLTLRASHVVHVGPESTETRWVGRIDTPKWIADRYPNRFVPWLPIWLGMLINTLLYSAALYSVTLGPFVLRRALRRHHGRCASCGYDLRGAAHRVCPECGAKTQSVQDA